MASDFIRAIEDVAREKGVERGVLFEAIEAALISAYRRNFGSSQNVRVEVDRATGEFRVLGLHQVVDEVSDARTQVGVAEARAENPRLQVGDVLEREVTPRDFGRIAAQTAKQVVMQRIREAERGIIYEEFQSREGDIVTAVVSRPEARVVICDLCRAEAILPLSEQMPGETYVPGQRMRCYVLEVKRTPKGPQVMISRTHPALLKRLFELEVPELHDGSVELKAIAREPGSRSKAAVWARVDGVDAQGACIGPKGARVHAISQELRGEKVDIVRWAPDPQEFVANALQPAKVTGVAIEEETRTARVTVPEYQLSLAIGKEGQNARLAARLTGYKIDIKAEGA